jgi:signal peptidase II
MSPAARLRLGYGLLAAAVVVVDQITKRVVNHFMTLHQSRELIPGILQLTYVRNRGAAFGFLANVDFAGQATVIALVSLAALCVIALYAWWTPVTRIRPQTALALVLGGAVGNLIDRVLHGDVIDFIDVYWRAHHWPMFNAADSAISIGVALLVLDMLREPRREKPQPGDSGAEPAGRVD